MTKQFLVSLPLVGADLLATLVACLLGCVVSGQPLAPACLALVLPLAVGLVAAYALFGLYSVVGMHPVIELKKCLLVGGVVFVGALAALLSQGQTLRGMSLALTVSFLVLLPLLPLLRRFSRRMAAGSRLFTHPVLIFGNSDAATGVYRELSQDRSSFLRPVGIIATDGPRSADFRAPSYWYTRRPVEAAAIIADQNIHWAILVGQSRRARRLVMKSKVIRAIPHWLSFHPRKTLGRDLWVETRHAGNRGVQYISDQFLLPIPVAIKRAMDVALASMALLVALPVMLAIGCLVKLTSRGPVFFKSPRIGRDGRQFNMLKFRSMQVNGAEILNRYLEEHPRERAEWEASHKLKHDPRMTQLGAFLRRFSLDELPQVINVLRGDMSMVGPRPMLPNEVEMYGASFRHYCRVRPGITGMWQVSGRSDTTFAERVGYVTYYLANWSIWLDLWILARTVEAVFFARGAY